MLIIRIMNMPYRKKPCLAIEDGNAIIKVATFNNIEAARFFSKAMESNAEVKIIDTIEYTEE